MTATPPKRGRAYLHQRGTSALVLSRSDANAGGAAAPVAENRTVPRRRVWPTVLTWILLGSAIAALWALLLLGDSLVVNG